MPSRDNVITKVKADTKVFEVVVKSGVPMTEAVLNAVWRWYIDVELYLPLPEMPMADQERLTLAQEILSEMEDILTVVENKFDTFTEEEMENLANLPESQALNNLWRELAGVYAYLINEGVPTLSEEEQAAAHEHAVEMLHDSSGMDESEIRDRIRHDPTMRLMLRRSGLDPDKIK